MDINMHTCINDFHCDTCNMIFPNKSHYDNHCATAYHTRKKNGNINAENGNKNTRMSQYCCDLCNMTFTKNQNLKNHLLTMRHKKNADIIQEKNNNCPNCNKEYATPSGLWKHMQKCKQIIQDKSEDTSSEKCQKKLNDFSPEVIAMIMQNMQQMMIEQNKAMLEIAKNVGNHTNTNNSNNTMINDNKSFNLNFFLNERCKNAMNLSDFVNGVDISLDDFEETGRIGYVEGLSRIFCKELQKLDIYERPIHCSDAKRETFYIRENNKWEKDENKEMLLSAVKKVGKKNLKVLALWQEKHPGHKDVESKENDRYLKILTNVLCCGDTDEETVANYGKIIKNISLVTVVDKNQERLK